MLQGSVSQLNFRCGWCPGEAYDPPPSIPPACTSTSHEAVCARLHLSNVAHPRHPLQGDCGWAGRRAVPVPL